MLMLIIDLVTLVLATGGIVDCWLNGSIFEKPRARLSRWKLFSCSYCLNWEVPLWLLVFCLLPARFLPEPWPTIFRLPIWWQAAAYLAWIVNDWRADRERDYDRTKREKQDIEDYGDLWPKGEDPEDKTPEDKAPEDKAQSWRIFPGLHSGDTYYWFCSDACLKAYMAAGRAVTAEPIKGMPLDLGECANCGRELDTVPIHETYR